VGSTEAREAGPSAVGDTASGGGTVAERRRASGYRRSRGKVLATLVVACLMAALGAGSGFADGVAATGLDATLSGESAIAGTVSFDGQGLAEVTVAAIAVADPWPPAAADVTDGQGDYALTDLAAGDYRLIFVPAQGSGAATAWYDSALTMGGSTVVTVATPGDPVVVVNQELPPAATISGTVTWQGWPEFPGDPVESLVRAFRDDSWLPSATVETEPDGTYTLDGLPEGTYRIHFSVLNDDWGPWLPEWFGDSPFRRHSTPLTVAAGESLSGIDAELASGGLLEVLVETSEGTPIEGVYIAAYLDGSFFPAAYGTTGPGGYLLFEPIPNGPVRVFINPENVSPDFHSEESPHWYGGGATRESGTPLPFDSTNWVSITVELENVWEQCEDGDPWCEYEDRCELFPWECEDW
jgi:hypothetical protein